MDHCIEPCPQHFLVHLRQNNDDVPNYRFPRDAKGNVRKTDEKYRSFLFLLSHTEYLASGLQCPVIAPK